MTVLILVGLLPFAALGIALGHLLTPDSIGPAMGGGVALLAFLGGTWFPIPSHGFLHDVASAAALLLVGSATTSAIRFFFFFFFFFFFLLLLFLFLVPVFG